MTLNIPERYVFAINVLIAALVIPYFAARCAIQLVRLHYAGKVDAQSAVMAQPAGARSDAARPRAIYDIIKQRDIFNRTPAADIAPPVEHEDLNIKLLGTSHLTGGPRAFVIVADSSGIQQLYRLGETIPGAGRVVEIGRNRAIIEHDGRRVAIEIPRDNLTPEDAQPVRRRGVAPRFNRAPGIRRPGPGSTATGTGAVKKIAPNSYRVERSVVDNSVQHMAQLLTQVRALPVIRNGAPDGYRLSEIQPGSLFEQIGLRDGDVLTAVSGHELSDPAHALHLLSSLQDQSNITLNVLRDGSPLQISYTIH